MNAEFHFLRPEYLWLLFLLFLLPWFAVKAAKRANEWNNVCDEHLLEHILFSSISQNGIKPVLYVGIMWFAAVLAISGPTWEKLPSPVFKENTPTILVLDLSKSMMAKDISPSRLDRAKFKIIDILEQLKGGQTGLVVYSDEPYVISPLTSDTKIIANMLNVLEAEIMPGQGSRLDRALEKAGELLTQAGELNGRVIVLTDEGGEKEGNTILAVKKLAKANHSVSFLAIGTEQGAPIPYNGGFIKDRKGLPFISKLDIKGLQEMADMGNGYFSTITTDDNDILEILKPVKTQKTDMKNMEETDMKADVWKDAGIWLLLFLFFLFPFAFRKGWIAIFLFVSLFSSHANAGFFDNLWTRADQKAFEAFTEGNPEKAAELFKNKNWKATALYKAGKHNEAADILENSQDAKALYNKGNALAFANRLEEALKAYDEAIEKNPEDEDATYNRDIVKKLLEQQQQNQKNQQQNNKQDKQQQNQDDKQQSEQNKNQDKQQQNERQQTEQKNSEQEQKSTEQEQKTEQQKKQEAEQKKEQERQKAEQRKAEQQQEQEQQQKPEKELSEKEQAELQKLGMIPDDPSALIREKIRRRYSKRRYGKQRSYQLW